MSSTSLQHYAENTDHDGARFPVDVTVHEAITVLQPETIAPLITSPEPVAETQAEISAAEVAAEAYALYEARGCENGHDVEDWLAAEALIRQRRISN